MRDILNSHFQDLYSTLSKLKGDIPNTDKIEISLEIISKELHKQNTSSLSQNEAIDDLKDSNNLLLTNAKEMEVGITSVNDEIDALLKEMSLLNIRKKEKEDMLEKINGQIRENSKLIDELKSQGTVCIERCFLECEQAAGLRASGCFLCGTVGAKRGTHFGVFSSFLWRIPRREDVQRTK